MIKELGKKILICILIFIIMFNYGFTSITFATEPEENTTNTTASEEIRQIEETHNNRLDGFIDGLVGAITWIFRAIPYAMVSVFNLQTYAIAVSAGINDSDPVSIFITPFDIIFNRFVLTDINVFSTEGLKPDSMVATIRESIAMWHVIATAIAIGILIVILISLIVKLALLEDIAERKAKLKRALKDWFVSVLLVLLMSVIVIGIVNINNSLVNAIKGVSTVDISAAVTAIQDASLGLSNILGWGALITYTLLSIQTLIYLCKYIYRFFTIALLIVIAPLAPVPYSISKMNDQQTGTAFNVWLYEFINAVATQLIHCVVYTCIVAVAFQGFASNTELKGIEALAPATFAVFAMFFVGPAERLIRKIFRLKSGGGVRNVVRQVANGTRTAVSFVNSVNSAATNISNQTATLAGAFGIDLGNGRDRSTGFHEGVIDRNSSIRYAGGIEGDSTGLDASGSSRNRAALASGETPNADGDAVMVDSMFDGRQSGEELQPAIAIDEATRHSQEALDAAISSVRALPPGTDDTNEHTEEHTEEHIEEHIEEDTVEYIDDFETTDGEEEIIIPATDDNSKPEDLDPRIKAEIEKLYERLKAEAPDEIVAQMQLEELKEKLLDNIRNEIQTILTNIPHDDEEALNAAIEEISTKYNELAGGALSGYAQSCIDSIVKPEETDPIVDVIDRDCTVIHTEGSESQPTEDNNPSVDNKTGKQVDDSIMQYISQALTQAIASNPKIRQLAEDIVKKQAIFEGKVENEIDTSEDSLSQITFDIVHKNSGTRIDNYQSALRKAEEMVRKEGEASLASVEAFTKAPSQMTYENLTDAGKNLVNIQNMLNANGLATEATQMATIDNTSSIASQMISSREQNPNDAVIDSLNRRRQEQPQE